MNEKVLNSITKYLLNLNVFPIEYKVDGYYGFAELTVIYDDNIYSYTFCVVDDVVQIREGVRKSLKGK